MATDQVGAEKAPPIIERFVRQLVVTNKAVALYPPTSTIPHESALEAVAALNDALEEYPEITLTIAKQGLYFDELPVYPGQSAFAAFSMEFYNRRLAVVRFHSGATAQDLIAFLSILKYTPEELLAAGGYEAQLWDQGVGTITVVETQVTLVNQSEEDEDGEEGAGASETLTTNVELRPNVPRTRERIELARVVGDEATLKRYLSLQLGDDAEFGTGDLSVVRKRFAEFSRMIAEQSGPEADRLTRMLAEALWALDPEMRQDLLENELLPEARNSESMAGTLRRLDLEEVMRMLTEGDDFDERRVGFTRALKNLVQVSDVERERVAHAATLAMQAAGASAQTIDEVVSEGVPTKLTVRRSRRRSGEMDGAAMMALNLIDRAPMARTTDQSDDPEILALQEEAADGITEGEVIGALVTLAGLESRDTQFANTMSALEDALDALVARGDIETAADAAISLVHAAENPGLKPEQVRRLEGAVTRFARPEDIRAITQTLRTFAPGQPEYEAAQRLLNTLGALAVRPLLDQLADEADRAERKALVDLISKDAVNYIPELSSYVGDGRWYFVRNVVAILGSTKSPKAVSALERTLRHSEPRVRLETIRALSMIQDRMAMELLVAALSDEDAHDVQLAARYLALRGIEKAIPALESVAKGEGRGNRDNGPRVEAIEALGRLGATSAVPTLQALARKRSIIGAARAKELRTAAEAALAAIKAKEGK